MADPRLPRLQSKDDPERLKHNPRPKWDVPVELIEWQPAFAQKGRSPHPQHTPRLLPGAACGPQLLRPASCAPIPGIHLCKNGGMYLWGAG